MTFPNIAILHCHYRRGGVTQVVENQVAALASRRPDRDASGTDGKIILMSGGRDEGLSEATNKLCSRITIKGMEYDDVLAQQSETLAWDHDPVQRGNRLAHQLHLALENAGCPADQTIVHWHNHSLGKNVAAPVAIRQLTSQYGYRVLLQIHDFAEDFRPENYARVMRAAQLVCGSNLSDKPLASLVNQYLYPVSERIRYATLTSGDAELLQAVGLPSSLVDVLPNGVRLAADHELDREASLRKIRGAAALGDDVSWCVYPVRGIRRKNVGEFLLLSRLMPENRFSGITLPPATPIESASYQRWMHLGKDLAPRAVFDCGVFDDVTFLDNLAASSLIVSTSVAEGFGMAFLEPWLAGRGVVARRLPHVTDDFEREGVCLDRLYSQICIPGTPDWLSTCRSEARHVFQKSWHLIRDQFGDAIEFEALSSSVNGDSADGIDFAMLTTNRQIEVLRRMAHDTGFESEIRNLNPQLLRCLETPFTTEVLDSNRSQIQQTYSIESTTRRLLQSYQRLLKAEEPDAKSQVELTSDEASLAEVICKTRPFYPCRVETEID